MAPAPEAVVVDEDVFAELALVLERYGRCFLDELQCDVS